MTLRGESTPHGVGASFVSHREQWSRATPENIRRRSFLLAALATILWWKADQPAHVAPLKFGYGGIPLSARSGAQTATESDDQAPRPRQEYGTFGYGGFAEKA